MWKSAEKRYQKTAQFLPRAAFCRELPGRYFDGRIRVGRLSAKLLETNTCFSLKTLDAAAL